MKIRAPLYVFILVLLFSKQVFAQNLDFNVLPLSLNAAYTGLFDGKLRASALYKSQWLASKASFSAYGVSADGKSKIRPSGYVAAGAAFLQAQAKDGSVDNFSSVASVAYHKFIPKAGKKPDGPKAEIAGGLQVGYIRRNIDLSGDEYRLLPYAYRIGTGAQYFIANAGLSFSHRVSQKFSYTVGISGNNLNLFNDGTVSNANPLLRVVPSEVAIIAANWTITERVNVRPAMLHIINRDFFVGGSEFRYKAGGTVHPQILFLGAWMRTGQVITTNVGYEFSCFRISAGYDYFSMPGQYPGNGGVQLVARYIMPMPKVARPG